MSGTIFTDESNLALFYRISVPGPKTIIFYAIPLTPEIGSQIIGTVNEDYTMVGTLMPMGRPACFLQSYAPSIDYVQSALQIDYESASLMAALIPRLTNIPPADDLLAIAEAWAEAQPHSPIP